MSLQTRRWESAHVSKPQSLIEVRLPRNIALKLALMSMGVRVFWAAFDLKRWICHSRSSKLVLHSLSPAQIILSVIRGAKGKSRTSAYTLKKAILHLFTAKKWFPKGVYVEMESVQTWALRYGIALKKLAPR